MKKPIIVCAEVAANHAGNINTALEMIDIAAIFCKVDVVKFQKRNVRELLSEEEYNSPHPNPHHAFGDTYGKHREALEFTLTEHHVLQKHCQDRGVDYSCSVWDTLSAESVIKTLNPSMIKIPSASNTDLEMIGWLCDNYEGEIHISTGMTTEKELNEFMSLVVRKKRSSDLVLYFCVSDYPVQFEDAHIKSIEKFFDAVGNDVKGIGFSGHHKGIALDMMALSYGATYFERHFTLDRTQKGTDHAASLEPDGMRKLVRDLKAGTIANTYKEKDILDCEIPQRKKLKRFV